MKDERVYITHILEAIAMIEDFEQTKSKDTNLESMRYQAVLRLLQTLCESVQRLSTELKERYPDIAWREISGFRNILVHDYLGDIDHVIVWRVVENELPHLRTCLLKEV
jgi:uncharacterized protein with HEPN domain